MLNLAYMRSLENDQAITQILRLLQLNLFKTAGYVGAV